MRLTRITALTAVASLAAAVAMASPAQATEHNGIVESGELGLYYSPGSTGLVFDLYYDDSNFSDNVFPKNTSIRVDNNTASYRNPADDWADWFVTTGANYTGSAACLTDGYVGNATTTFRNQISSAFLSGGSSC